MKSIFSYLDYRAYLRDRIDYLRKKNPNLSFRNLSRKAGYASPNYFQLVMEGKRNLSAESIQNFAKTLKLKAKEARFFEILVHYEQSKNSYLAQRYYQELLEFPEYRQVHRLEKEQYDFLSHWFYPAILELASLADFNEDPIQIAQKLKNKISPKEAKSALQSLENLGFLKRNQEQKLKVQMAAITTGEEARFLAAHAFHQEILQCAKQALQEEDSERREFAAMTMAVSEEQFKKLKTMIRDFRKQILNYLSESEDKSDRVYQLGIQLFPLSAE